MLTQQKTIEMNKMVSEAHIKELEKDVKLLHEQLNPKNYNKFKQSKDAADYFFFFVFLAH